MPQVTARKLTTTEKVILWQFIKGNGELSRAEYIVYEEFAKLTLAVQLQSITSANFSLQHFELRCEAQNFISDCKLSI